MAILVQCAACKKEYDAPDSLAGQACRCTCDAIVIVPFPLIAICTRCGEEHRPPDEFAGQLCRCPCGNVVRVPDLRPANPTSIFQELTDDDIARRGALHASNLARPLLTDEPPEAPARRHEAYEKALYLESQGMLNSPSEMPPVLESATRALRILAVITGFQIGLGMIFLPFRAALNNVVLKDVDYKVVLIVCFVQISIVVANGLVLSLLHHRKRIGVILGLFVCILNLFSCSFMVLSGIFAFFAFCHPQVWRHCDE